MNVATPLLAAAGLLLVGTAAAQSPLGVVELNQPFPDLRLPLLETGELTSAREVFGGKKTVLIVFASW